MGPAAPASSHWTTGPRAVSIQKKGEARREHLRLGEAAQPALWQRDLLHELAVEGADRQLPGLGSQLKRVELTEPGVRPSQRQVDIHVRGAVTDIAAVEVGREDVEAGADTQQPEKDSSRSRSPWAVITGSSEAPALGR